MIGRTGLVFVILWAPAAFAQAQRPAPLKPAAAAIHKHPAGFTFRLPTGWKAEDGPEQSLVLPPGVTVDPNREDNPEILVIQSHPGVANPEDAPPAEDIRQGFVNTGLGLEKSEEKGSFDAQGRPGIHFTWDFKNPSDNVIYRVRLYAVRTRGDVVTLLARGHRARMEAREKALVQLAGTMEAPPKTAAVAPPRVVIGAVEVKAPSDARPPVAPPRPEIPKAAAAPVLDGNSPLAKLWVARLYGRLLAVPGRPRLLILRRDGTYSEVDQPTLEAVDGAPAAGRWTAGAAGTQAVLELRTASGAPARLTLETQGGKTLVGGVEAKISDPR